jgi:hypothetical protein
MVTALIHAFLQAKMKDARTSVALYSVSSDVDGAKISQQMRTRSDPQLVAFMLEAAMEQFEALRRELIFMVSACLSARPACGAGPRPARGPWPRSLLEILHFAG